MVKAKSRAITAPSPERELKKWSCSLFGEKSEIDVFVESSGRWQTAAEVHSVGRFDAEEIAVFIIKAITACRKGGENNVEAALTIESTCRL